MATMQQHRDRQADDLTQDDGRNSALQADEPQVREGQGMLHKPFPLLMRIGLTLVIACL